MISKIKIRFVKIKRIKKVPIPIYQILWISNESIIKKFSNTICFLIIIRFNVFSVNYSIQSEQISTFHKQKNIFKKEYKLNYLIKSNNKNFVPPLGSELSIKYI